MSKVTLAPSGNTIYVDNSKSLLDHLRENNVYIKSSCGGHASCTDCIVKVLAGNDQVNEPTKDEVKLLGNVFHITKERLSCQLVVEGDITIDMSDHDQKSDETKLIEKNRKVSQKIQTSKVKVRKKEEYDQIIEERKLKSAEKRDKKENWHKHWEKEGVKVEKSLGGNRRPKKIKDID